MQKIKELMAVAVKKGFATEEEHKVVSEMAKKLSDKEYKEISEDIVAYEDLPFEKPVVANEEVKNKQGKEDNQPTKTRAERRAEARAVKGK